MVDFVLFVPIRPGKTGFIKGRHIEFAVHFLLRCRGAYLIRYEVAITKS